jgi:ABC-type transport system substrate-binding protein
MEPELATALPEVSADGRTYTFTIAGGSAFAPPSGEAITAATYAYSIERALSPVFGDQAQGARLIDDIEGEAAYRAGTAQHISGIHARADTLSITLTAPSDTFLDRLAFPSFCPVPLGTPIVAGGVGDPTGAGVHQPNLPSSGPYYISYHLNGELTILQRNPNYSGPRSPVLDAIALREGIDPAQAIGRVQDGSWDMTMVADPSMDPGGALDEAWGPSSAAATAGDQRYYTVGGPILAMIALNAERPMFSDVRVRRAVALALSRADLSSEERWTVVADTLIPTGFPGAPEGGAYDLRGDAGAAGAAMDGARGGTAVLGFPPDCSECEPLLSHIEDALAPLHIDVRSDTSGDVYAEFTSANSSYDMFLTYTSLEHPDGATFLSTVLGNDIPSDWLPASVEASVDRLQTLDGDERDRATEVLAARLAVNEVPAITYGRGATTEFFSPRLGCRGFPVWGYGVDFVSLCLTT